MVKRKPVEGQTLCEFASALSCVLNRCFVFVKNLTEEGHQEIRATERSSGQRWRTCKATVVPHACPVGQSSGLYLDVVVSHLTPADAPLARVDAAGGVAVEAMSYGCGHDLAITVAQRHWTHLHLGIPRSYLGRRPRMITTSCNAIGRTSLGKKGFAFPEGELGISVASASVDTARLVIRGLEPTPFCAPTWCRSLPHRPYDVVWGSDNVLHDILRMYFVRYFFPSSYCRTSRAREPVVLSFAAAHPALQRAERRRSTICSQILSTNCSCGTVSKLFEKVLRVMVEKAPPQFARRPTNFTTLNDFFQQLDSGTCSTVRLFHLIGHDPPRSSAAQGHPHSAPSSTTSSVNGRTGQATICSTTRSGTRSQGTASTHALHESSTARKAKAFRSPVDKFEAMKR